MKLLLEKPVKSRAAYSEQRRGFLQRGPSQGRQQDSLRTSEFLGVLRMRDCGARAFYRKGIDSAWSGHPDSLPD